MASVCRPREARSLNQSAVPTLGLALGAPWPRSASVLALCAPLRAAGLPQRAPPARCLHPKPWHRKHALGVLLLAAAWAIPAHAEVNLPPPDPTQPIVVQARHGSHWKQGPYDVWLLHGGCRVTQGTLSAEAEQAVLWIRSEGELIDRRHRLVAYLEGATRVTHTTGNGLAPTATLEGPTWFGQFESLGTLDVEVAQPAPEPRVKPPIYRRGMARRDPHAGQIRPTQFDQPPEAIIDAPPPGTRRLRAFPRSSVRPTAEWFPDPQRNESVAVITGGINLIIDGLDDGGTVDILADRMVIWSGGTDLLDLTGTRPQATDMPIEIYMEGNLVFRQGERVVYAERMYYDVNREVGTILGAEVLTPAPSFQGLVRLRADVAQMAGRDRIVAQQAWVSSSRMGLPRYRLQAQEVLIEDRQRSVLDPSGAPLVRPETGEPLIGHAQRASSRNNVVYLGPVPVLYWPFFSTDVRDATYFVRGAQLQNDRVFGTWGWIDFDTFQVLGWEQKPPGTDWLFELDYLTERGFAFGTLFQYDRQDLFGFPGQANGLLDAWAIDEQGLDTLGRDRRDLVPEADFRYRIRGQHRQYLADGLQFSGELGVISDRNFLEQYFEQEWDQFKDQTTGAELKFTRDAMSLSLAADARVNDFFTQTEWLPRLDHFWLGVPLLRDRFTWFAHSQAAFARLRTASTPLDPRDAAAFAPLPWERTRSGGRFATRQELDLPLALGPVKVVPYILGEAAHWGDDLSGNQLDRLYGQVGIRASLPFWAVDPYVQSTLFNVHGIAHKVTLQVEAFYADASRNLDELPLYDPLDDDAQEHFRRRLAFLDFGGMVPARFDERFYALRSGLQRWVASPSLEVADDLEAVRVGLHQRWQTKRGLPGQRRIIDWIVFDLDTTWFPEANRDNFGSDLGLTSYAFRWHVGDRLTLVSDGIFDFFSDGQRLVSLGAFLSRPPRGSWYVGFRSLHGPINADVLTSAYSYRLSPKWLASVGAAYDFASTNIGNSVAITRIGESFLTSVNFYVDAAKNNVGANFLIEPRFLSGGRLGRVAGAPLPVVGAYGLE